MLAANLCIIDISAVHLIRLSRCASWLLFAAIAAAPVSWAADANDVAEGMRIFQQKANCQACHGWAGDGRKMDAQMPDGANLRETKLDRGGLVLIMKCGLPGTGMPAFDRLAYSDGRCGRKQADLQAQGLTLFDPGATLQAREIEMVADFMLAKIVGKGPMNRVRCAEFWGSDAEVCRELPK